MTSLEPIYTSQTGEVRKRWSGLSKPDETAHGEPGTHAVIVVQVIPEGHGTNEPFTAKWSS
jgi:hypothetical protein